jgi:hypothetical protein
MPNGVGFLLDDRDLAVLGVIAVPVVNSIRLA